MEKHGRDHTILQTTQLPTRCCFITCELAHGGPSRRPVLAPGQLPSSFDYSPDCIGDPASSPWTGFYVVLPNEPRPVASRLPENERCRQRYRRRRRRPGKRRHRNCAPAHSRTRARPGARAPAHPGTHEPFLGRPPDALGAAHARRERSRHVRRAILARVLPAHEGRRSLSQRRWLRRLLSDRCGRIITAANGSAIATRSANWSTDVASSAWSSSRAPIRTPRTTTRSRPTPTGSTSPPTASRAATGRRPSCGSPARSDRTTSSS